MKSLFLILFIIYISELTKTNAKILPRPAKSAKRVQTFAQGTLETRDRNEKKEAFENLNIRKANTLSNIPVYIITRVNPKPIERMGGSKYDDLFDENGMIYVTKPKRGRKELNYLDLNGRRTYDLSKRNKRKLMAMMNKELNRQLLMKSNNLRKGYELDFTDLVA